MKRIAKDRVGVVYFKRWSRKNYAAFVSMRFNVLICFLKKSVVEASLFKVEKYIKRGEASEFQFLLTDGESKAPPNLPDAFMFSLLSLLSPNWRGALAYSLLNDGKEKATAFSGNSILHYAYDCGAVSENKDSAPFVLSVNYIQL